MSLEVLFEDNHIIAVNKKAGDIVQGDKTGDTPLSDIVKEYIRKKYNKPGNVFCGVPHRLDRPVTGVILFAKTTKALERLNKMFQKKEIQKTYWALTVDPPFPADAHITHYLVKNRQKNITKAHDKPVKDGLKSELIYSYINEKKGMYLVEVNPLTGRPHQIRVQLSTQGAPIKGDLKYGAPFPNKDKSICLHARKIEFIHPVSKEKILITAPLPKVNGWENF